MIELFLYGGPHSSFVRTTRMALHERNVPYTLVPCAPGHVDGDARHPFSKIPFMRYGDFILAESLAIIRFTEREFSASPSLWPTDSRRAALCDLDLVPILYYLGLTKEGQAVLPHYPAIQAWQARMAERPGVQATVPPS